MCAGARMRGTTQTKRGDARWNGVRCDHCPPPVCTVECRGKAPRLLRGRRRRRRRRNGGEVREGGDIDGLFSCVLPSFSCVFVFFLMEHRDRERDGGGLSSFLPSPLSSSLSHSDRTNSPNLNVCLIVCLTSCTFLRWSKNGKILSNS